MTNRDKINGMSNAMLADILSRGDIPYNVRCKLCIYMGGDCFGKSCSDGIKAWLNAPAEKIKELADRG